MSPELLLVMVAWAPGNSKLVNLPWLTRYPRRFPEASIQAPTISPWSLILDAVVVVASGY